MKGLVSMVIHVPVEHTIDYCLEKILENKLSVLPAVNDK